MKAFTALLLRDVQLAFRQGADAAMAVLFSVMVVMLFPFGVGPEPEILAGIAAGLVWVAALLASMLSLDRLFQADYEDGTLDALFMGPLPLFAVALAKVLAHWIATSVPLIVATPLLAILLNMPASGFPSLVLSMALGTPTISLIGGIGAALTLGARRAGVLVALLVLPLVIPVLIFGAAAVEASLTGLSPRPHLLLLGALLLAALPLTPWAMAAALRQALA
ncbi:MAG: heme exporter protein CcmB [Proteobacteria bacterium]|nr:heme exporter protein CcmB [Pseudomonadota bacterium]MBI3499572.1 heme exporter protein CcmB [Pseudomonadota bacterium]